MSAKREGACVRVSHRMFLAFICSAVTLTLLLAVGGQPTSASKMFDYKDKMEKYVLGYKLLKHLEPKHTYVHWEAPEQFPPVVLPARVVSPHHPLLYGGQPFHVQQPARVHVLPPRHVVAQPVYQRPAVVVPRPPPAAIHIDRQDKGQIVVQGSPGGPNGKVKCPYEVYRIRQL